MSSDKRKYDGRRKSEEKSSTRTVGLFGRWKLRGSICGPMSNWRSLAHKRRRDTGPTVRRSAFLSNRPPCAPHTFLSSLSTTRFNWLFSGKARVLQKTFCKPHAQCSGPFGCGLLSVREKIIFIIFYYLYLLFHKLFIGVRPQNRDEIPPSNGFIEIYEHFVMFHLRNA